ncbi:hypothetical protein AA637_07230 [Cyanobacterium sp. HL-69]|uniref:hypothetical protein n=1 Tax=unclassified Cyanobacterium TaxID=2629879 RepID=UPI0008525943|nr:hypothetical protein [Cyanobacterium sp. IPPAS B-1200]AUC60961.1 hypothetical protein AA637_07230 [Cyanobacterium sp. HL-69]OEJ78747.1 hypothetical protein A5482_02435 [Cyanobacterium sp. IPPAS B-1200]
MRRRSRANKIEMELFPFLSVLACTIGTLILLIIVISTESIESSSEVTIIGQTEEGQNSAKTPRYIECREDGIILHPSEEFVPRNRLSRSNSPLLTLIEEVENNRNNEYVIVILRPTGLETFYEVRDLIEARNIDIGYEPIDEGLTLKFAE